MKSIRKSLSVLLSIALITMTFNSTHAAMIANDVVIALAHQDAAKAELLGTIQRADVRQQLLDMGVDPQVIESRINLMTSEEIARMNQQIEELPAGGDLLGILLVIFIVFVITDVIGATDIFPFIKPVN